MIKSSKKIFSPSKFFIIFKVKKKKFEKNKYTLKIMKNFESNRNRIQVSRKRKKIFFSTSRKLDSHMIPSFFEENLHEVIQTSLISYIV